MELGFLFPNWWSLSIFTLAWAKKMSLDVYEESLTILSNIGLGKTK